MKTGRSIIIVVALAMITAATSAAQAAPFVPEPGSPFAVPGIAPTSALGAVRAADFTGDGVADLAVSLLDEHAIATFIGDGAGGFSSVPGSPFVASTDRVNGFAPGDFDGDGTIDLVAGALITPPVTFLHGHGNGVFDGSIVSSAPNRPGDVVAADLDGDAHLDVVATDDLPAASRFSALIGHGDGTFTATPVPLSIPATRVVTADFDGDGITDVAAMGATGLQIAFGDTSVTPPFTLGPALTVGPGAYALVATDLTGDGSPDLAVTNRTGNSVSVLVNDGHGTFTAQPNMPVTRPLGISAADFDHDGHQDLAVTASTISQVTLLLGDGAGHFTAGPDSPLPTGSSPSGIVARDFDGDGYADLAVILSLTKELAILHNGFAPPPPPTPAPSGGAAAPVIDAIGPPTGSIDGGERVTISGQNFGSVRQVWFGDTPVTSFSVERYDRLTAVAPPHAAGLVGVRVETDAGSSGAVAYRYLERETTATPAAPRPEGPTAPMPAASAGCTVPSLHGARLNVARERLRKAGCALGTVRRTRGPRGAKVVRVTRQSIAAGRTTTKGRRIAVTVKPARR